MQGSVLFLKLQCSCPAKASRAITGFQKDLDNESKKCPPGQGEGEVFTKQWPNRRRAKGADHDGPAVLVYASWITNESHTWPCGGGACTAAQRYLLLGDWSSSIEGMTRRMPMFGTRHRLLFASLVRIAGSIGGGCPRKVQKGHRWGITSFATLI